MTNKKEQLPVAGGPAASKKDHRDFTMLTRGYIRDIRLLSKRNPAAFQVLLYLAERMTRANAVVMSAEALGDAVGYSRSTIHRAVTLLESEQWLQVLKSGNTNAYIINSRVLWRDHTGKRFSSFFAEVIISENEQGRSVEEIDAQADRLRNVPIVEDGMMLLDDGAELDPPDQHDLLPPVAEEFPRTAPPAVDSRGFDRIDRQTGEYITDERMSAELDDLAITGRAAVENTIRRQQQELADLLASIKAPPLPPR